MSAPTVEQIEEVLAGHWYGYTTDEYGWEWAACQGCSWPNGKRIGRGPGYDAHRTHQAEQVAALGMGEPTEPRWGWDLGPDDPRGVRTAQDEETARYEVGRFPHHRRLMRREVTAWVEVTDEGGEGA